MWVGKSCYWFTLPLSVLEAFIHFISRPVLVVWFQSQTISVLHSGANQLSHLSKSQDFTLTHWGRVMHICVGNLTIIGSDNGLSPGRRQAITWTNVGILLIGPLWTNFSKMLFEIHTFSFKKIHLKMSGKWRPFCLGLNVLRTWPLVSNRQDYWLAC